MTMTEQVTGNGFREDADGVLQDERSLLYRVRDAVSPSLRFIIPFAILIALWWGIKELGDISDTVLASPADVVRATREMASTGVLAEAISGSLRRLGIGAIIGCLIGVPVGLLLASNPLAIRLMEPLLRFMSNISGIAWLPLVIVWFGFGDTSVIIVVVYTFILPILFNSVVGARTVKRSYVESLQAMGATRRQVLFDVYLRGALPSILVGVGVGLGYSWRAVVAGEMLVEPGGLGELIFAARTQGATDRIMAGMVLIGILFLLIDRLIIDPMNDLTVRRWGLKV